MGPHNIRQAEQLLRESEQLFRLVADAAPVPIWMSGANTKRPNGAPANQPARTTVVWAKGEFDERRPVT